jgi:hypothetical protein
MQNYETFDSNETLGFTFPLEAYDEPVLHGYTPLPATANDPSKPNGTASVKTFPGGLAVDDASGNALTNVPLSAIAGEEHESSLKLTIYPGIAVAYGVTANYQLQVKIYMPDPKNTSKILEWTEVKNFSVKGIAV